MWVMKEYGVIESWNCIFKCNIPHDCAQPQRFWFRRHQGDILILEEECGSSDDETYRLRSVRNKQCLGRVQGQIYGFYLGSYFESLALLKEGKAVPVVDDSVDESEDRDSSEDEEGSKVGFCVGSFLGGRVFLKKGKAVQVVDDSVEESEDEDSSNSSRDCEGEEGGKDDNNKDNIVYDENKMEE